MHHFPSLLTDLSPVRGNASAHETRARSRFSSESCTPWLTQKCGRRLGETRAEGGGGQKVQRVTGVSNGCSATQDCGMWDNWTCRN